MIIFVYGTDGFRIHEHVHKLATRFSAERDPQQLNFARIDCQKQPQGLMEQIFAAPFLAEKRMVVVEHVLASSNKELQQALLEKVEEQAIPDTTILVLVEHQEKFKTKLAKQLFERLSKEKFAQQFSSLTGAQLAGWIASEVQSRSGSIERNAAQHIAMHAGDMWRIHSLIDQLCAYKQGKEITIADVELFVEKQADDNIFTLVDAIVGKRKKDVFAMLEQQYNNGKDAGYIFAMLLRQFRILLELRELIDTGNNMRDPGLAKAMGLHPFVVKKSIPAAQKFSLEQLHNIYDQLLSIDIKTKKGLANQRLLIDVFVAETMI